MTILTKVFEESFEEFLERERDNILNGVAERNLCARWAIYLQAAADQYGLDGYIADPEYDRNMGEIKTIIDDKRQIVVIVCDLILHSRGKMPKRDNLIAIEMKKAQGPKAQKDKDRLRLRALTKDTYDNIWSNDGKTLPERVCGYELGFFVELDHRKQHFTVEEYRKGQHVRTWSGDF